MTMKVHELAKELNLSSKEVLEKLGSMGVEAKGHMSVLSDIDAIAVRNIMMRGKAGTETKIVKVVPKKSEQVEEPKVVVKAAAVKQPALPDKTQKKQERPQQEMTGIAKPPIGKPVISKDLENRPKPPVGTPVVPKDFESRTVPKPETSKPQPEKSVEKAPVAETSVPNVEKPATEREMRPATEKSDTRTESNAGARTQDRPGYQGDKPRYQGDRPRQEGDRPRQGYQGDRPRQEGDRPRQGYQGDRPRQEGDRPRQGYQGDRPRQEGDRPRQGYQGDRPRQEGDRPRQGYQGDRPRQEGDRPRQGYQGDRPRQEGDRPRQGYQGDRPRPQGDRPQSSSGYNQTGAKPGAHGRKDDKQAKSSKPDHAKKPHNKPATKQRSLEKQVRPKKQQRQKPVVQEPEINLNELPVGTKVVNVPITVAGFCEQVEITTSAVIMSLMRLGIMANINQSIDEDTVLVLAEELGINVVIGKVEEEIVEEGIETHEDKEEDLSVRPPIITVMGHVDHGKTSLLDAIRTTNVTASESGGITQHIGASEVMINGQKIVFLDTPGHEAFTAMRARGAHVTDIAVLVVAADDSVKPQTIESISHAKAAGVPVIVAINKIDKPAADLDKVKNDLSVHGILVEDWGGDTIAVPVSAKSGEGIVNLLEMILLQAEVLELKANPHRLASGTVIEARLDKAKGPVATLLVLNGTLRSGTSVVAGTSSGKIRLMTNHKGETIKKAGPATAVEILGLTDVPEAGDEFHVVKEDKIAREIAENRKIKLREEVFARNASTTLEQLFSQIQEGEVKELNLIIKGDVQGSVGALEASLEKLRNENVRVKIIHTGVGTVTESDVMLAGTSGAVIIGFNVRPSTAVSTMADRENVEIRTYRVIYDAINDVEAAMKGMLDPVFKEVVLGKLEIRNIFKVPGIGNVGGAYVTDGKIVRSGQIRLVRDGIVIHEGRLASLKRFKDDVKEVMQGYECGVGIENYNDIKEGDIVECFIMEEIKRT